MTKIENAVMIAIAPSVRCAKARINDWIFFVTRRCPFTTCQERAQAYKLIRKEMIWESSIDPLRDHSSSIIPRMVHPRTAVPVGRIPPRCRGRKRRPQ
jgi:hypothetical protein